MANLWVATWANYDVGSPMTAATEDLRSAVRRAAKAANQRLVRLERAGFTGQAYKMAMKDLHGRRRYYENTAKLTTAQLRHEYAMLRDFISAKTSTVQGVNAVNYKRYIKAVERGYDGSEEEFYDLVDKYFSDEVEELYSSDIIYAAVTEGNTDVIDRVIARHRAGEKITKGKALLEYMRAARARKGS